MVTALNNWTMCVAGENACPPEDVGALRLRNIQESHG